MFNFNLFGSLPARFLPLSIDDGSEKPGGGEEKAPVFEVDLYSDKTLSMDPDSYEKPPGDEKPGDEKPGDEKPGDKNVSNLRKLADGMKGDEKPGDEKPSGNEKPGDKPPTAEEIAAANKKIGDDAIAAKDAADKLDADKKAAKEDSDAHKDTNDKGIPKHLVGETDAETVDKLNAAYQGLRKKVSDGSFKAGSPPATAADYNLAVDDTNKQYLDPSSETDQEVFDAFAGIAHDLKLTDAQYNGVINQFMAKMAETGIIATEPDMGEAMELLGGQEKGLKTTNAVIAWGEGLLKDGTLTEAEGKEFEFMAGTGVGISVMNKLRLKAGGDAVAVNIGGEGGSESDKEKLEQMRNDPKMMTDSSHVEATRKLALKVEGKAA